MFRVIVRKKALRKINSMSERDRKRGFVCT